MLTAQPWAITTALADGLDADAIRAATGVVAMFNYLTRVADASGIEFDYTTPLPAFRPRRDKQPVPRPAPDTWPVVTAQFTEAWRRWHDHLFGADEPLTRRQRLVLARAAAQESCDRRRADELAEYTPSDGADAVLDAFARKLSVRPWQMTQADLQTLRDAGFAEQALLHAMSVTALQNAESRLAAGQSLVAALTRE